VEVIDEQLDERVDQPDIVVYLVDTLRADRLGCYGYPRAVSPRLDAFAQSATLFENAIAQSSWTRPSVASIFTGQWPGSHDVSRKRDGLTSEAITLAENLRAAGYATAACITNPNVAAAFGFDQGFEVFQMLPPGADSTTINEWVFSWLEKRRDDRPLFLYLHTADPHSPYLPPEDMLDRWAPEARDLWESIRRSPPREIWDGSAHLIDKLLALYDAEVAANDRSYGELLDYLAERNQLDDALVVFLADHGEEFYDHGGWSHGRSLFVETLDFPFVVKLPRQRLGTRVDTLAQHIDLMPTLLDYLGLPLPQTIEGRSLLAHWSDNERTRSLRPAAPVFSHLELNGPLVVGAVFDDWKLIDRRTGRHPHSRLFNRRLDRNEKNDLHQEMPITSAVLLSLLDQQLAPSGHRLTSSEAELDPELEASLKALGYL
jgi:arylsulfatase A-like enzyme